MSFVGKLGRTEVLVAAGQTITVNSFGAGSAKVFTGTPVPAANVPVSYTLNSTLTNSSVEIACATATMVKIDASVACDAEYYIGSAQRLTHSWADGLTALASGGQTGATPCLADFNRFTTVANAADSSLLPVAAPGLAVVVINAAASNSMNVFPATGDAINALSANSAFAVAANKACIFFSTVAGHWQSLLTA